MIERTYGLPEGVIGLRATGEVTREDYERVVVPLFDAMRAKGEPIHFLCHIPDDFENFTAGAAWEDLKIGLRHMRLIRRCAVVTDVKWIRTAVKAMALVAPTRLRSFEEEDLGEAIDWLEAKGERSTMSYRILQNRGVLVLEPHDELHVEDIDRVASLVDPWIDQGDLAGVVIHAERFGGWEDLAAMVQHMRFVRAHLDQVPRVALAIDGPVVKVGRAIAQHLLWADVRRFDHAELEAAIAWVSGDEQGILGEQITLEEEEGIGSS